MSELDALVSPIVIIGCGARKVSHDAPALDLYTGPLFRARREWSRATFGVEPSHVLSGLFGLLDASTFLAPYEHDLRRDSKEDRAHWTRCVERSVRALDVSRPLVVLASGPYLAPFDAVDLRARTFVPARGLTLGASLAFYARARRELAA